MQIGAVRVDSGNGFVEQASFSVLVRPMINPELSAYFVNLTGIKSAEVAQAGVELVDALSAFAAFAGTDVILSLGCDDLVIGEDCALKDLDNPFAEADWRDINPPLRATNRARAISGKRTCAMSSGSFVTTIPHSFGCAGRATCSVDCR